MLDWFKNHPIASSAIVATLVTTLIFILSPFLDRHEGTAAWVQAAGALLIIVATARIANENDRKAHKREEVARQQLREAIATISESYMVAYTKLNMVCSGNDARSQFQLCYAPSDFDTPLDGLTSIPLHQLGDAQLITAVLTMRSFMGRLNWKLAATNERFVLHSDFSIAYLKSFQTGVFNAHSSIWRIVYGPAGEDRLRRFAQS